METDPSARGAAAAKGVVVAQVVAMLKKWRKANPGAALPALSDEDQRYLGAQRILATEFYDLGLYHRLLSSVHDVVLGGGAAASRAMGEGAARIALEGVYRIFVREGDPGRTLDAVPRMWAAHYQGSTAEVELLDHGARVVIRGYGPMPGVMQEINAAWMETCVALAGARDIRSTHHEADGVFTVELHWSGVG